MKYIVITAKHHDGFAMFDSQGDPITSSMPRRSSAIRLRNSPRHAARNGIKLGFYYSQAQDWHQPAAPPMPAGAGHWDKAQEADMDDYIDKIAVPQVRNF